MKDLTMLRDEASSSTAGHVCIRPGDGRTAKGRASSTRMQGHGRRAVIHLSSLTPLERLRPRGPESEPGQPHICRRKDCDLLTVVTYKGCARPGPVDKATASTGRSVHGQGGAPWTGVVAREKTLPVASASGQVTGRQSLLLFARRM
jgi:hypothetical protein